MGGADLTYRASYGCRRNLPVIPHRPEWYMSARAPVDRPAGVDIDRESGDAAALRDACHPYSRSMEMT